LIIFARMLAQRLHLGLVAGLLRRELTNHRQLESTALRRLQDAKHQADQKCQAKRPAQERHPDYEAGAEPHDPKPNTLERMEAHKRLRIVRSHYEEDDRRDDRDVCQGACGGIAQPLSRTSSRSLIVRRWWRCLLPA